MEERLWFTCCCAGFSKELSQLALGEVLAQKPLAGVSFYVLILYYTSEKHDPLTERAPSRFQPMSAEMKFNS